MKEEVINEEEIFKSSLPMGIQDHLNYSHKDLEPKVLKRETTNNLILE